MSDTDTTSSNRPTHRLFHVVGEAEKANWIRIGAAWPHKDSKGFNIDLEYIPQKRGRIVLREQTDQEEGQ
ncbi:hypothetical protein [Palleronia pelagia]|uniref:Uncharacterized protein n=1 Tax=Palleronia pelagia TaxID=387096 RepID=A0A1H8ME24_9RHOB|nr:hypothetical protein [Palleronia pelagia]SEO15534.1 hypothetical protein SAMN04488011_1163 [Palleronia pelagia]